ncbi:MAG UNVERIFIED_CONTAM: hypothetical protein LVR29_06870 [Microcystis novacekii LVE1205-3]
MWLIREREPRRHKSLVRRGRKIVHFWIKPPDLCVFVGYIPQLVTGGWLGNDNNKPTNGARTMFRLDLATRSR